MEWKTGATIDRVVAGGHGKGNGLHQLSCPTYAIVDEDSLFVCDQGNHRVMLWRSRGDKSGEVFVDKIYCYGLALDDQGWLHIKLEATNRIFSQKLLSTLTRIKNFSYGNPLKNKWR